MVEVRYQPGIQTTDATDTNQQQTLIADRMDALGIRLRLPGNAEPLTGATLRLMSYDKLRAAGVDPNDLWQLLDDCVVDGNRDSVIDLGRPLDADYVPAQLPGTPAVDTLASCYGLADKVDGNYGTAVAESTLGKSFAHTATRIRTLPRFADEEARKARRGVGEKIWNAICDLFRELFTLGRAQTWLFNKGVDSKNYEFLGATLVNDHPESLLAAFSAPHGRDNLRKLLDAQRPKDFKPEQWRAVVTGVLDGMEEAFKEPIGERADREPTRTAYFTFRQRLRDMELAPAARDQLLRVFESYAEADGSTHPALPALVDLLGKLKLTEAGQESMATMAMRDGPTFMVAMDQVSRTMAAAGLEVRERLTALLEKHAGFAVTSVAELLSSPEFKDTRLTDGDRVKLIDLLGASFDAAHVRTMRRFMFTACWQQADAATRDRIAELMKPSADRERTDAVEFLTGSLFARMPAEDQVRVMSSLLTTSGI